MASQGSSSVLNTAPSFDEERWVMHISTALDEEEEEEVRIPVSVFSVPKPLLSAKPEAFTPQLFAIGPYHHWQPALYEMERYKLATARRTQKQLKEGKLHQLVEYLKEHDYKIRAHYHRYLDYSEETIAWMMVIDASFLAEFLRNYSDLDGKAFKKIPSMSHMVDSSRMKLAYNLILRDVVMLENQIPLFVVRRILCLQTTSQEIADNELSKMLTEFVREISPFAVAEEDLTSIDVKQYAHLLQLLYCMIIPKSKITIEATDIELHIEVLEDEENEGGMDASYMQQLIDRLKDMNISPIRFVKKILTARPLRVLVKVPWTIVSKLPIISLFKGPVESLFAVDGGEKGKKDDDSSKGNKPMLVEEIMIPSVSNLARAGVKFSAAISDLSAISFDPKTATMYLPAVSLDSNTEVLMRNLVAYETTVESGPMVFTRYTELINGIIDSEEDVKLLRESGIIVNRMKNDDEVASLWNGMSRSVRLSKVGFIDKVLVDVNKYYNSRWSVKSRRFMKTYVLGSWQFLTFLAAILLLLLTCVQAFCSVYNCSARLTNFTNGVEG